MLQSSVFVEFTEPAGVDAFLMATPKPTWEGKELLIMTKCVRNSSYFAHNSRPHREEYCDLKIKEKGLSGKAADKKHDQINQKRFNAFRLKENKGLRDNGSSEQPKKDVYLEFMGTKLFVHQDESGNGSVKEEEVPYVKGATLKFDGCGEGNIPWADIKVRHC